MDQTDATRWNKNECAVFWKVKEEHGGLSNMASGFPLVVNGHPIRSSEALYQAMRFPHAPDVQRLIIDQKSPMAAKMVMKPHKARSRADWEDVKLDVMLWALRVKLAQNPVTFRAVLEATGDRRIVEKSRKDRFWGAVELGDTGDLEGVNALGQLLVELRGEGPLVEVPPLDIPDFLLFGEPIKTVKAPNPA